MGDRTNPASPGNEPTAEDLQWAHDFVHRAADTLATEEQVIEALAHKVASVRYAEWWRCARQRTAERNEPSTFQGTAPSSSAPRTPSEIPADGSDAWLARSIGRVLRIYSEPENASIAIRVIRQMLKDTGSEQPMGQALPAAACELCKRAFPSVREGSIHCRCDGSFVVRTEVGEPPETRTSDALGIDWIERARGWLRCYAYGKYREDEEGLARLLAGVFVEGIEHERGRTANPSPSSWNDAIEAAARVTDQYECGHDMGLAMHIGSVAERIRALRMADGENKP